MAFSGTSTERGVTRTLATRDALILDEPTENLVTERPQSISPDTPIEEAMEIKTERETESLKSYICSG